MKDEKLLKLAAKAINLKYHIQDFRDEYGNICPNVIVTDEDKEIWNPLEDDGDALRLAVDLDFSVLIGDDWVNDKNGPQVTCRKLCFQERIVESSKAHDWDRHAATRRAIVRAAAKIGELK